MSRIAVFGGTSEGRKLAELLAEVGAQISMFVATSYGEETVHNSEKISVICGRLNCDEMQTIFKSEGFEYIVDATHPYANEVTVNLLMAAKQSKTPYLRVTRRGCGQSGEIRVESAEEAARYLKETSDNILLTTGSKSLHVFTGIENWRERLYARVLPDAETLEKCAELGFKKRNLICMQGPFSSEMNSATIKMYDIKTLVTKDSGDEGGFPEKLSAAKSNGVKLVVIRRPEENNEGVSVEAAMDILITKLNLNPQKPPLYQRFPLFIPLEGKAVLIVGGGKVAARRARQLMEFGASVTVISPEINEEIREIIEREDIEAKSTGPTETKCESAKPTEKGKNSAGRLFWKKQLYDGIDWKYSLVIAATNDREVNRRVGENAKTLGIPVSIADRREESTFWFPAIARGGGIVAGLVSETGNHSAVKETAIKIRKVLGDN